MENTKYTKAMKYADIEAILSNMDSTDYDIDALIEFVQTEAAALERKATKAKEKAAEKKEERDELCEAVLAAVSEEPALRDEIAERVDFDGASVAKVGARLNKLVAQGLIVKSEIKVKNASGKSTARMVYSLPVAE